MKKLMLTAAICLAAVVSQAATTKWTATTGENAIYLPGSTESLLTSGTAYLFCLSTASGAAETLTTYTQGDILTAFKNGTDISTLDYQKDLTVANGKIPSTSFTSDDFSTGKATTFFFAIVKDEEIFISGTSKKTSNATTPQALTFNPTAASQGDLKDITGGYTSTGWYGTPVPEPTSGLLMLLGIAGLALRRKHA